MSQSGPPGGSYSDPYSYNANRGPSNNWTGLSTGAGGGGMGGGMGGGGGGGGSGVYSVPPPAVNQSSEVSSYNQARNTQAFQWSKEGSSQRTAGMQNLVLHYALFNPRSIGH